MLPSEQKFRLWSQIVVVWHVVNPYPYLWCCSKYLRDLHRRPCADLHGRTRPLTKRPIRCAFAHLQGLDSLHIRQQSLNRLLCIRELLWRIEFVRRWCALVPQKFVKFAVPWHRMFYVMAELMQECH